MGCTGCVTMEKPPGGWECKVKICCEEKELDHCGLCGDFPCEMVATMGVQYGFDPKPRLDNLRNWAEPSAPGGR